MKIIPWILLAIVLYGIWYILNHNGYFYYYKYFDIFNYRNQTDVRLFIYRYGEIKGMDVISVNSFDKIDSAKQVLSLWADTLIHYLKK